MTGSGGGLWFQSLSKSYPFLLISLVSSITRGTTSLSHEVFPCKVKTMGLITVSGWNLQHSESTQIFSATALITSVS